MKQVTIIIGLIFWSSTLIAQEGGEIEDAQIIIEKDKPLTLPKANRIYKRTSIKSVEADVQEINYQVTQPSFTFERYQPSFQVKSFDDTDRPGISEVQNFVKAGYGNYNSFLIQSYVGYREEQKYAGLWFNHETFTRGPVRDKESAFGFTEFKAGGGWNSERLSFDPQLYFQRQGYFLYGYDANQVPADFNFEDIKVGTHRFAVNLPVSFTPNDEMEVKFQPGYQFTGMKFQDQDDPFNTENLVHLTAELDYSISASLNSSLSVSYGHFDYEGGLAQNRSLFEVHPEISFNSENLILRGGIRYYVSGGDSTSGQFIMPDVMARYMLNENLSVTTKISGEVSPVTLDGMQQENRYLEDSLLFLNEIVPVDIHVGVSFASSDKLQISPYVNFRQTENKGLFVHSPIDSSRFTMVFDQGKFKAFSLGADLRYLAGTKTTILSGIKYTNFSPDQLDEAWYLPVFEFNTIGRHDITEKLNLELSFYVMGGIIAPRPVTMESEKINPIVDLGLRTTYNFTNKFSAFVDLDNLLSTNYERYLNYPSRGFMIKGGFTYRF